MGDAYFKTAISTLEGREVCKLSCAFFELSEVQVLGKVEFENKRWRMKCKFPPKAQRSVPLTQGTTYSLRVIEDGREGEAEYVGEEPELRDRSVRHEWWPRLLVLEGRSPLKQRE